MAERCGMIFCHKSTGETRVSSTEFLSLSPLPSLLLPPCPCPSDLGSSLPAHAPLIWAPPSLITPPLTWACQGCLGFYLMKVYLSTCTFY